MDKKVMAFNLCCERQHLQREKETINKNIELEEDLKVKRIKEINERLNIIENKLKTISQGGGNHKE